MFSSRGATQSAKGKRKAIRSGPASVVLDTLANKVQADSFEQYADVDTISEMEYHVVSIVQSVDPDGDILGDFGNDELWCVKGDVMALLTPQFTNPLITQDMGSYLLRAAQMRGAAVVRGVTKERLDQLRITKYNRAERNPESPTQLSPASVGSTENEDVCPICLIEFEDGEDVRNLPCKHIFHVACIDEWLKRNTSCPMCKSNVDLDAVNITVENPPAPARGGAVVTPVTTSS
ncbi:hypothetical protein JG687_00007076 [Phytophthora cactorum]|uniref:RING-type domain-containing protein n=2 Tax=Phytophthora TaxID=4783 RepID=A0A8J5ITT3_9STRA|nr:hypothetical protein JG687_00007076 [Phytophthora cactorum]KAG6967368.1 hypothetical protein JG688_00006363 [Phytophthora aleatoria]